MKNDKIILKIFFSLLTLYTPTFPAFHAWTPIKTPSTENFEYICKLQASNQVNSVSEKSLKQTGTEGLQLTAFAEFKYAYIITFHDFVDQNGNDIELVTCADQQFAEYYKEKWVKAKHLKPDDLILCAAPHNDYKPLERLKIKTIRESHVGDSQNMLCEITVPNSHAFYVTEKLILAHNMIPIPFCFTLSFLFGAGVTWFQFAGVTFTIGVLGLTAGFGLYDKPYKNNFYDPLLQHPIPCTQPLPTESKPEEIMTCGLTPTKKPELELKPCIIGQPSPEKKFACGAQDPTIQHILKCFDSIKQKKDRSEILFKEQKPEKEKKDSDEEKKNQSEEDKDEDEEIQHKHERNKKHGKKNSKNKGKTVSREPTASDEELDEILNKKSVEIGKQRYGVDIKNKEIITFKCTGVFLKACQKVKVWHGYVTELIEEHIRTKLKNAGLVKLKGNNQIKW